MGYCGVEEEEDEVFVVHPADAVAHPGTVMVHPLYALFADAAVVDSGFLHHIAFEAVADIVECFYLLSG